MKSPWVPFDYYLAGGIGGQIAFIAEPNWLKSDSQTNPIGTGPFVFQEWNPNDHFTATRNPHYWRPNLPYLDSITYRPIPDSRTAAGHTPVRRGGHHPQLVLAGDRKPSVQQFARLHRRSVHVAGEPDMLTAFSSTWPSHPSTTQGATGGSHGDQLGPVLQGHRKWHLPPSNGPFVEGSPYFAPTGYPEPDPARAKQLIAEVQQRDRAARLVALNHTPDPAPPGTPSTSKHNSRAAGIRVSLDTIQQAQHIGTAVRVYQSPCLATIRGGPT